MFKVMSSYLLFVAIFVNVYIYIYALVLKVLGSDESGIGISYIHF